MRKNKKMILIFGIIFFVVATPFLLNHYFTESKALKNILNVDSLPSSLREIRCDSYGFNDYFYSCYFEINPNDFDQLLKGWKFEERVDVSLLDHRLEFCNKTLSAFPFNSYVITYPKKYEHGGSVTVIADSERKQVCVEEFYE